MDNEMGRPTMSVFEHNYRAYTGKSPTVEANLRARTLWLRRSLVIQDYDWAGYDFAVAVCCVSGSHLHRQQSNRQNAIFKGGQRIRDRCQILPDDVAGPVMVRSCLTSWVAPRLISYIWLTCIAYLLSHPISRLAMCRENLEQFLSSFP